jgi:hypothetical protein
MLTSCEKPERENESIFSNDIISFNISSGEIIFTDRKMSEIVSRENVDSQLQFFIDGKPVFTPRLPSSYFIGSRCSC